MARAEAENGGPGDGLDGGLGNGGCEGGSVATPVSAPSIPAPALGGEAVAGKDPVQIGRFLGGRIWGWLEFHPRSF